MEIGQHIGTAVEHDIILHELIADLAGNKALALMLQSVVAIGRLSHQVAMDRVGVRKASEHHGRIAAAIIASDSAAVRLAMKEHVQGARADLASTSLRILFLPPVWSKKQVSPEKETAPSL